MVGMVDFPLAVEAAAEIHYAERLVALEAVVGKVWFVFILGNQL